MAAYNKALLRTITVFSAVILTWLLAELVLTFFPPQPIRTTRVLRQLAPVERAFFCYSSNPHNDFRKLPDTSRGSWRYTDFSLEAVELPLDRLNETPWVVEARVSEQGLRDRIYTTVPAAGIVRIGVVGDSFVYGQGVPEGKTLSREMGRLLGAGYEVPNIGRVAIGLSDEVPIVHAATEELNCSRILLVFIPNDIERSAKLTFAQDYIDDLINIRDSYKAAHEARAWYNGPSRVLRLVGSSLDARGIKRKTEQWYLDMYDPAINGPNLNLFAEDLRRVAAVPNSRVAFVMFPLLVDLKNYPLQPIHDRVGKMAREAGLPVLDLAPVFADMDDHELQVHPTDHHPNSKAHAMAAKAIVDWLRSELPEFLAP